MEECVQNRGRESEVCRTDDNDQEEKGKEVKKRDNRKEGVAEMKFKDRETYPVGSHLEGPITSANVKSMSSIVFPCSSLTSGRLGNDGLVGFFI